MQYDYIECGDCLELMKKIPDGSIDLIVTDPPYLINYSSHDKNRRFCKPIKNDKNHDLVSAYIKECYRVMKDNTAMYMFCNASKVEFFKSELEKYFNVKNMIIWVKNNWTGGDLKGAFGKQYEIIFLLNKGRREIRGKRITDVWVFPRVVGNKQLHQNQKPIELIQQCIEKHSDEGDIVFDGFLGSGTTAIACVNTNRHYIGFEIEKDYFEIAKKRIEDNEVQRKAVGD